MSTKLTRSAIFFISYTNFRNYKIITGYVNMKMKKFNVSNKNFCEYSF